MAVTSLDCWLYHTTGAVAMSRYPTATAPINGDRVGKLVDVIVAARLASWERLTIEPDTVDRMRIKLLDTSKPWTPTRFYLAMESD